MRITMKQVFDRDTIRREQVKKIGNNTFSRVLADGTRVITLHRTDIIKILPNGDNVLTSGGWHSVTTKERLSRYNTLGLYVCQRKGNWFVGKHLGNGVHAPLISFYDGMIVSHSTFSLQQAA